MPSVKPGSTTAVAAASAGTATTTPALDSVGDYVAPFAPAVEADKKSPTERMVELDQMKGLLTEDEYEQKRAEILSDV